MEVKENNKTETMSIRWWDYGAFDFTKRYPWHVMGVYQWYIWHCLDTSRVYRKGVRDGLALTKGSIVVLTNVGMNERSCWCRVEPIAMRLVFCHEARNLAIMRKYELLYASTSQTHRHQPSPFQREELTSCSFNQARIHTGYHCSKVFSLRDVLQHEKTEKNL